MIKGRVQLAESAPNAPAPPTLERRSRARKSAAHHKRRTFAQVHKDRALCAQHEVRSGRLPSPFGERVFVVEMATGHDFLLGGTDFLTAKLLYQKEPNC